MGDSRTAKKKEKMEEEFLLCLLGAVLEPARGQPGRMRPWLGLWRASGRTSTCNGDINKA